MVQRILPALMMVCFCVSVNAQKLQNFDYYFAHPDVSQDAKEYYANMFDLNSSNKTYSILDSAFTDNNDTRPFYVYLICKMLPEASPELLKEINIVCRFLTEERPGDVTAVLFAGSNFVKQQYRHLWAHRLGVEIRVTCGEDLMQCFKKSRTTALEHFNADNKSRLEAVYNMTRKELNLFQQH